MATNPRPARKRAATTTTATTTAVRPRARRRRRPTHAQIAERAYFISLERNDDDELGHWISAEQELLAA